MRSGFLKILASRGIALLAQLAALLLLARYLTEEEFGLAWMVAVVVGVFGVAADFGMEVVVVQRRDVDDRHAAQLSAFAGLICCLLIVALAPMLARAFGSPKGLMGLLRAGSVSLLFTGFAMPARGRMRRDLEFGRLAAVDVARAIATGGAAVALAFNGSGARALVLGDVIAAGLAAVLAWLLAPGSRAGSDCVLMADGTRIVGTRAADACFAQADRFFVGSQLGTAALGLYGFAWRHAMLLVQHMLPVADQVALPMLSRLRDDRPKLVRAYLSLTRVLALVIVPGAALLYALAPWLLDVLYPERWQAAVPAVRALCVAAAAAGVNSDPGILWLALGRTRLRLLWSLANLPVIVAIVCVGARDGVVGVAYALAIRSLLATVAAQIVTRRIAGVPHRGYVFAVLPGAAVGAVIFVLGG